MFLARQVHSHTKSSRCFEEPGFMESKHRRGVASLVVYPSGLLNAKKYVVAHPFHNGFPTVNHYK